MAILCFRLLNTPVRLHHVDFSGTEPKSVKRPLFLWSPQSVTIEKNSDFFFFYFNIEHTYYPKAEGKQEHIAPMHRAEEEGNKGKRIKSEVGE